MPVLRQAPAWKMYKITDSGEEILYAIFDYASKCFTRIGD